MKRVPTTSALGALLVVQALTLNAAGHKNLFLDDHLILIASAERGGYDGYSHNCVINKYDPDTPNELMIEYSIRYRGRDTNTYVFFVRPKTEPR